MTEPAPHPPGRARRSGAPDEEARREPLAVGALENAANTLLVLRPLATPLPLGFLGLFFATMLLAGVELGWVPRGQEKLVVIGVLVLTVPVQLIACIYGFLVRDLVAGTGMGILAGTWALQAVVLLVTPAGSKNPGLAWALVLGGTAVCVPAAAALQSKILAGAVQLATALRWWLTAVYEWGGSHDWRLASGAMGVALGLLALYAALAFELEDQARETILPTFRRASGLEAMSGDLGVQVNRANNEAGVRKQL